jgi:hypothetical protein
MGIDCGGFMSGAFNVAAKSKTNPCKHIDKIIAVRHAAINMSLSKNYL